MIREIVAKGRVVYQGTPIQITLSIGGVVCQLEENWDECIILADRALYFGKNHGKNLAVFAKGDLYCVLGSSQEAEVSEIK
jgi:PleD family two-component response regulator